MHVEAKGGVLFVRNGEQRAAERGVEERARVLDADALADAKRGIARRGRCS